MVFFITMCIPWESNPQPFALLTQCSTTEPQEHSIYVSRYNMHLDIICFNNGGMIFKHISDISIHYQCFPYIDLFVAFDFVE